MKENNSLDALMLKEGTELTTEEIIDSQKVIDAIDSNLKPTLAYSDSIVPGTASETSGTEIMSKEEANSNMIKQLAMNKLSKEKAEYAKKSDEEKIRDYVIQAEYWRNCNDFFKKHGYELSGQQKHTLKRKLERAWDKGKLRLTPSQRQDILFEINKASNSMKDTNNSNTKITSMGDLNSLIKK